MDSYPSRISVVAAAACRAVNRTNRFGLDKSHGVKVDRT